MALTETEKIKVFQIIGVPYGETVFQPFGNTKQGVVNSVIAPDSRRLYTVLNQYLDTVSTAIETEIRLLVNQWITLSGNTTSIAGQIGSISVDYSPTADRQRIKEEMLVIVPVMNMIDELEEIASSPTIPILN